MALTVNDEYSDLLDKKTCAPAHKSTECRAVETIEPKILNPADPMATARLFVKEHHTHDDQGTLFHQSGCFYRWSGSYYPQVDAAEIRKQVYELLEAAVRDGKGDEAVPFQPTKRKVDDVVDAVRAVTQLPSSVSAPAWLNSAAAGRIFRRREIRPAEEFIAFPNGLLHLPTQDFHEPTPVLFTHNAVEFDYHPTAPEPKRWLEFLNQLWPEDSLAIESLRHWFGYCLTPDTSQQKIFLIAGPKRSGKGTIAGVLRELVGKQNVCAPTLASLAGNFGLASMIGKTLAIIADARLGGRSDQAAIAERLLSVSGEDTLSIPRKFLPDWTGKLNTRFMVLTNELPRISDTSGALASRFILLTLTQSFYGKEDHRLFEKLRDELPGIALWAIQGWIGLQALDRIHQPKSSLEALQELEDLSSPVAAFVRDRCDVGPDQSVEVTELYRQWRVWCEGSGRSHPGTLQNFGRDIRAVTPGLLITRPRIGDERVRRYEGIGLKTGFGPHGPRP